MAASMNEELKQQKYIEIHPSMKYKFQVIKTLTERE